MKFSLRQVLTVLCFVGIFSGVPAWAVKDHWQGMAELQFPGGYLWVSNS